MHGPQDNNFVRLRYDVMTKFDRYKPEIIADNDKALEIITSLGLLDEFLKEQASPSECMFRSIIFRTYKRHESHWILTAYFHNFDDEKENGYFVASWPKNLFPDSILDEAVDGYGGKFDMPKLKDKTR